MHNFDGNEGSARTTESAKRLLATAVVRHEVRVVTLTSVSCIVCQCIYLNFFRVYIFMYLNLFVYFRVYSSLF